jgi:hypothetical protein
MSLILIIFVFIEKGGKVDYEEGQMPLSLFSDQRGTEI